MEDEELDIEEVEVERLPNAEKDIPDDGGDGIATNG